MSDSGESVEKAAAPVAALSFPQTKRGASDDELAKVANALKEKPDTWTLLGIMVGVVAVPTGIISVWFPREIDQLERKIDAISISLAAATDAAKGAEEASSKVSITLDSLVVAIARENAVFATDKFAAIALKEIMPSDIFAALSDSGDLAKFKYSNFNGQKWLFISEGDFSSLESKTQIGLKTSFDTLKVNFYIDSGTKLK